MPGKPSRWRRISPGGGPSWLRVDPDKAPELSDEEAAELREDDAAWRAWTAREADRLRRWLDGAGPLPESVRDEIEAARALGASEAPKPKAEPPKLALSLAGAAAALGVSDEFFAEQIKPELKVIRRGRRQLVAVDELRRWLAESGARTLS